MSADAGQAKLAVLLSAALDARRDAAGALTEGSRGALKALARRLHDPRLLGSGPPRRGLLEAVAGGVSRADYLRILSRAVRLLEVEKKDSRGHRMCFDDDTHKRVKCPPREKPKKGRPEKADPEEASREAHEKAKGAKDAERAADILAGYGHAALKALARRLGQKMSGGTIALAQRLAQALKEKPGAAPRKTSGFRPPDEVRDATEPSADDPAATRLTGGDQEGLRRAADNTQELTGEDAAAVRSYLSTFGCKEMNAILRGRRTDSSEAFRQKTEKRARLLNEAIKRSPKLKEPVTVYRGMVFDPNNTEQAAFLERLLGAEPGHEVESQGFMSASHHPGRALEFAGAARDEPGGAGDVHRVMLEVRADQGLSVHKAAGADSDSALTEMEFLMAHGSRFRVVGHEKIPYKRQDGRVVHVHTIQLEQVA